jgi:hypothetical protein
MHRFKLVQKSPTKFQVMSGVDVVGSINLAENEVGDFLKHWAGPIEKQSPKSEMVRAMMKARSMTKPAILR